MQDVANGVPTVDGSRNRAAGEGYRGYKMEGVGSQGLLGTETGACVC